MGIKISQFPAASAPNDSDVLAGVQTGTNKKFSFALILAWIKNHIAASDIGAVPDTRTINGQDLSADITLTASDIGAVDSADVGVADGVASLDSNGILNSSQAPPASDIDYDNTTSGLASAKVQGAIDEIYGAIPADASDVDYDNSTSGLSAANVQAAVDEVASDVAGKQDTITASGILKGDGAGGVTAATPGTDYQAPLTFDNTPTAGSDNPVKSYGIYDAMYSRIPLDGMGRNLLDNPFFAQAGELPVNQRGQSNYSSGYTIDRWKIVANGTVNLIASGLSYTRTASGNGFAQFFSPSVVAGKNINASVLLGNDTLISQTASIPASPVAYTNYINKTEGSVTLQCYQNGSGQFVFQISTTDNNSVVLVAAKLEWGTGQTLAHKDSNNVWVLNEIPDYGEELRKCQAYYWDSTARSDKVIPYIGARGQTSSGNSLWAYIFTPVPMRATPIVDATVYGIRGNGDNIMSNLSCSATPVIYSNTNLLTVTASGSSFPANSGGYSILFSKLTLSAEP